MKKYEFTGEEKKVHGMVLKRIRALVTIAGIVSSGDCGGWIESETNLTQVSGDAWVFGNAWVSGNAQVSGDAQVFGNAWVFGNARVSGNARVFGNARVSGNARVFGSARVFGNAQVSVTPILITGLRYPLTISDNTLAAGCQCHTFEDWRNKTETEVRAMDGKNATDFYPKLMAILEILQGDRNA